jgi:hypothetical protein
MMGEPMAVAFTVWNRPHYLAQVLEAWSRVRGISDAVLLFSCEPGCDEAVDLCKGVDFAEGRVLVNSDRLGASLNTRQALDLGCRVSDYVIQATDDFVPSDDVLELNAWHRDRYRDDPSVLSLVCQRQEAGVEGGPAAVWRTQITGWLPGFHREKWQRVSPHWTDPDLEWYSWIDLAWCQAQGLDILRPALSRAQDIGEVGWQPLPYAFDLIQSQSFSPHYDPQQYYEVQGKRQRGYLETWVEEY